MDILIGQRRIEFVRIDQGRFWLGSDAADEPRSEAEEQPRIQIDLATYWISRFPVTIAAWAEFTAASVVGAEALRLCRDCAESEESPITMVTWFEAASFCHWVTEATGYVVSLPIEYEWEKMCRGSAGLLTPWPEEMWDGEWPMSCEAAGNYRIPSVGKQPSLRTPYGVEDVWTLVGEWCDNWYDPEWYSAIAARGLFAPTDGKYKAIRGGNRGTSNWPRCCFRGFNRPDLRNPFLGFRLAVHSSDM